MITEIMYKYAAELDGKDAVVAAGLPAVGAAGGLAYNKLRNNRQQRRYNGAEAKIKQLVELNRDFGDNLIKADMLNNHTVADPAKKALLDKMESAWADAYHGQKIGLDLQKRDALNVLTANRKVLPKHIGAGAALAALPAAAYLAHRKLSKD